MFVLCYSTNYENCYKATHYNNYATIFSKSMYTDMFVLCYSTNYENCYKATNNLTFWIDKTTNGGTPPPDKRHTLEYYSSLYFRILSYS